MVLVDVAPVARARDDAPAAPEATMGRRNARIGLISVPMLGIALGCGVAAPRTRAASEEARAARAAARFEELDARPATRCGRVRPGVGPVALPGARQGSPVALARSRDGARTIAFAADADQDAIHAFDVEAGEELAVTPIDGGPTELLVLADGRIAVTLRDANRVALLEPRGDSDLSLELRCSTPVAVEPFGLAALPSNAAVAVASGFGHALTVLETEALAPTLTADLPRDPRSVLIDAPGRRAFVSHAVGGQLSVVDLERGAVRSVELGLGDRAGPGTSPLAPRQGVQGFALAAAVVGSNTRVFAPIVSVDAGPPTLSGGYGSSSDGAPAEMPMVSVIDAANERPVSRVSLGAGRRDDCLLPRSAAVLGDSLFVTCLGSNVVLDLEARAANPLAVEQRRFMLPAGPTGLAADAPKGRIVVWSQFAHALTVIDLESGTPDTTAAARRVDRPDLDRLARGRELFHATFDRRISRDGRACASCHPDGREDGLTWSTPDGPRQTPMLAGRVAASAPYGWFGKHATLTEHVTHTFDRLGGAGFKTPLDQADRDALLAYVVSMKPPKRAGASPESSRAALVARGKELFDDTRQGCATCHTGGGADGQRHDVGSGREVEKSLAFDTPSLEFVGGTAPYFHDGRYATLMDVLDANDAGMGHTAHLDAADKLALAAYLESL